MYKNLRIYSYNNSTDLENEYNRRLAYPSTIKTNLMIFPFSQQKQIRITDKHYPLFYLLLPDHVSLIEKIFELSTTIMKLSNSLPEVALHYLRMSQLVNEIKSTNDIEGVKSSKKEIDEAIQAQNTNKKVRFKQSVNTYLQVMHNGKPAIENLVDIRKIFDDVVLEEIEEKELPDGKLFRKKPVYILDEKKERIVHQGNVNEIDINRDLNSLIQYMNSDVESFLIKAIITHYYLEYIHPFYDGNGRLGRFLLTSYLSDKLDVLSALSISEAIYNDKKKYEDAFIEVSFPKNHGEVTFFILDMLKIIVKGQKNIKMLLEKSLYQMTEVSEYVNNTELFNESESQILFVLLQHFLFATTDRPLTNKEITDILDHKYSRAKIDKSLKELEIKNIVKKINKNPIAYEINPNEVPIFE